MAEHQEGGLADQLERLEKKLDLVEEAARRSRNTARIMTLVIAIVAIAMVWLLVKPLVNIMSHPEPYQEQLARDLNQRFVPQVRAEATTMVNELRPVYQEAFERVRERRGPEVVERVQQETVLLVNNFGTNIQEQMTEFQTEFEAAQLARLKQEFPQLTDEDYAAEIVERVSTAMQRVVERVITELFAEHYDALLRLETSFNGIGVPDDVAAMSPEELEEHISAVLMEYFTLKLDVVRRGGAAPVLDEDDTAPAIVQ